MTELEFIATVKFRKDSPNANICNKQTDLESVIAERISEAGFDGDDNYLGYIPIAFTDAETTAKISAKAYRSFHDGIEPIKNGLKIFYRAAQDADENFFREWLISDLTIKLIELQVNDEDESTVEELGKSFKIQISRNDADNKGMPESIRYEKRHDSR